jgi:Ca-activated chloride channel homolog
MSRVAVVLRWVFLLGLAVGLFFAYRRFGLSQETLTFALRGETYEFLSPKMLGVVLVTPFFLWMLWRSLADLSWPQRAISVTARIVFVALLALALARLSRTESDAKVCTTFLVDVSESIPDEAIRDAERFLEQATSLAPKNAEVRAVRFADRAEAIVLTKGAKPTIARFEKKVAKVTDAAKKQGSSAASGTDVQSALELAYGMFPEGYVRRVVMLSDGVETSGSMLAEAANARRFGVSIDSLPYARATPGEVAIRDLSAPDRVRVGEPFTLRAQVFSSREQEAKFTLKQGEAINGLDGVKSVKLARGENEVSFKSVVRVAGEVTYDLSVSDMPHDRFVENNRFVVSLAVPGKPAVLYAEGNATRASYFANAMNAQEFDVDVRSPRELPDSMRELERYDAVVLSDAPAESVSLTKQDALEQYVRDLGGGFIFVGGEAGYGLGGWAHTTVERMLPVSMDAEKKKDEPVVAMVLVIDRSGSMSGLPLEMAKAAAKATADTLANDDLLEIIVFDSQPTRIVRLTPAKHRARIQGDLSRIQPGGGTEIFPAVDAAYQTLSATRAKRKHVILLTDGQANSNGIKELVQTMASESITLSTVGLGTGIDESLLKMMAEEVGGGRFYKVPDPEALPKIFTRETELVSRSSAVEEYFQPKVVASADFMRGVDMAGAPFLHGYVATRMKPPPAQELLQSDVGEPLLARWRVGLGWSVAWTSDVKNLWSVEWLKWPGYGQFWSQLVREHMRARKRTEFKMKAEIDPTTGNVRASIDAIDADDSFQNGLTAKLTVRGPEPKGEVKTVAMTQTAPGRYESDFALAAFGSYLLHAVLERSTVDKKTTAVKTAQVAESFGHITSPYPREYLALEPNVVGLRQLSAVTRGVFGAEGVPVRSDAATPQVDERSRALAMASFDARGERVKHHRPLWPVFVFAAILVYLLDVLLRRVHFFRGNERVEVV